MKCRYEYYSSKGKQWTDWFEIHREVDMEFSNKIDKKTKLRHEYKP